MGNLYKNGKSLKRGAVPIFWILPFGNLYMGGDLSITAKWTKDQCTAAKSVQREILGENPSAQQIKDKIGSDDTTLKIACWESGYKQFFRDSGIPYEGLTNDFGIFQVVSDLTCDDVWNWQKNIDHGKTILNKKRENADNHHTYEYQFNESLLECIERNNGFTPPALSNDPNYAKDQRPYDGKSEREREAIRRYNAGREHHWEITNQQTCEGRWIIQPKLTTKPEYVKKVLDSSCP
jgi:hypothetical protein